jgi:GT2 family glycosyltransferase
MSSVSILIPSWNGRTHLEHCLAALEQQVDPGVPWDIWVLDNGSADDTVAWLGERHPHVRVIPSARNLGFAPAMNALAAAAEGRWLALLNNDTRPEPTWLGELVEALGTAPPQVGAVSGLILDWEGARLDFADGVITFDGHAFQRGYRQPFAGARLPEERAHLPFVCGANALIRREVFEAVGGFDADYFAYFEDVDLGWRLRLAGHPITFARHAVIHHRSMATSELLGRYRRGVLFERNAFATAFKNLGEASFHGLFPAIFATLMMRTATLLADNNPGGASTRHDPFPRVETPTPAAGAAVAPAPAIPAPAPVRRGLRERLVRYGWRETARRGLARAVSSGLARGGPVITDPRTLSQLQAVSGILGNLDRLAAKRAAVQALRRVDDRELLAEFPLWIVPTYPGDEAFFASAGFEALLPRDVPLVRARLDELMTP